MVSGHQSRAATLAAKNPPFFEAGTLTPFWDDSSNATPATVSHFKLVDHRGRPITEKIFEGRITVVNFFFAQCRSVCPLMIENLKAFQKKNNLKDMGNVQFLSFSVTPQDDTPAVLSAYMKAHGIQNENWNFITGDKETIYSLGRDVFRADGSVGRQKSASGFIHTENVYLVDQKARLRGIFESSDPKKMALLATDIVELSRAHSQ